MPTLAQVTGAWAQTTLLDDALAACEPKALRHQLLHAAARLTRG